MLTCISPAHLYSCLTLHSLTLRLITNISFPATDAQLMGSCACAGGGSVIKKAVIDNNVAIGSRVRITNADGVQEADRSAEGFVISEGIVVVLRNTIIPDGTTI